MKYFKLILTFSLIVQVGFGQPTNVSLVPIKDTIAETTMSIKNPRLILYLPVLDLPYLHISSQMTYNKRLNLIAGGSTNPTFQDYLMGLENPSMQQVLATTKNLHATNYYFNNILWNKWVKPSDKKHKILNRIGTNVTSTALDLFLAYIVVVPGPVWLHEQFHRGGLTIENIGNDNGAYDIFKTLRPFDVPYIVDNVKDQDLINFKKNNPAGLLRSYTSGIEGQYELLRNMRKDNFFKKTNYSNAGFNILVTQHAVGYVNLHKTAAYDSDVDLENRDPVVLKVKDRDYVGGDFTAWVYDMHRQGQPLYRTPHPSGMGFQRNVKRGELSAEEEKYLNKMGAMSYINFLSPEMIGITAIPTKWGAYNFAAKHMLNSFGYDIGADIFLDVKGHQYFVGLHGYKNQSQFLPGIEIEKPDLTVKLKNKTIPISARAMLWAQPKNLLFKDTKAQPGGLIQMRANYPLTNKFSFFADCEAKSKGFVAGNAYLNSNFSFRTGIYLDFQQKN